ncbi:sulfotransferase family protein [Leisingera sp. S232]|uniref:sulfotransferase family protein n=1 Tax=Leisingera sp. S232 TaxID=3415132 RepID=UPI0026C38148
MTVRVLYIAGAGRSGSTFLSLMLSQHPQAQNIGQIRDLPAAQTDGVPCSCRQTVPDCPFWGPVIAAMEARFGGGALQQLAQSMQVFGKAASEDTRWGNPDVRKALQAEHAEFLEAFGALYEAASQQAGGRMLIDSSKSVDLCLALSLLPQVELKILNLVRDPRAVAVSWAKVLKRPKVLRGRTRNWAGRQKRLEILRRHAPADFMPLRYEDLTEDPQTWTGRIQDWAGLERDLSLFTGFNTADISWERAHLFPPANATVLKERKETIEVTPAGSWKRPENAELHAMAEELTFPFAETLGYSKGIS